MSCVHLENVEDLVVGTIGPERATELRAHLEGCEECAVEHAMLLEERELFARRAAATRAPLPALELPAPPRPHPIARFVHRAMHSQALPALAAAFFLFAGVSRMGGAASPESLALPEPHAAPEPIATAAAAGELSVQTRVNASLRSSEPLSCATDDTSAACLANVRAIAIAPATANDRSTCEGDDVAMSRALSSMCEQSVTSSMSRQ